MAQKEKEKIRYAVVGQGHIAQTAILPAFKNAENSELVALVSGHSGKLDYLGRKYKDTLLFKYEEYDTLLRSREVDAVYIALPNHLHKDFAVRAARAGIHILCEKPMATNVRDCEEMIRAAEENRVKLMVAYRLHFEPANLQAIELVRDGDLGDPRVLNSVFGFTMKDLDDIRLQPEKGGGPLLDIGIYCINATRYLFQDEPIEITALPGRSIAGSSRIDEGVAVVMRFPEGRLASFICSFNSAPLSFYRVVGTNGELELENAYDYEGESILRTTIRGKAKEKIFRPHDQFAPELIYFSECILKNRDPEPSGMEGLADIRVIEAIQKSIELRRPVVLSPFWKRERPGPEQEIERPPIKQPKYAA